MKTKYFLYFATIVTAFLFACEKEIKFSGEEMKTQLVLNGLLTADSVVKINLTSSRFFLDDADTFKNIDHAIVTLWKEGNKIEEPANAGAGFYVGRTIPKPGNNFRITVSCEGFDPIECSTGVVSSTPILSADTIHFSEQRLYSDDFMSDDGNYYIDSTSYYLKTNFDLCFTFKDSIGIPNYYTIKVYMKYYYKNGESFCLPLIFNSEDLVFQRGNTGVGFLESVDYLKTAFFNDELFDGKDYKLTISAKNWDDMHVGKDYTIPGKVDPEPVAKEITLELQSLSYEYYMYLKTREAQSKMSKLIESFSESVQIYTNVKGGIGILGSYASSVYRIP